MCTVTYLPLPENNYIITSNRDEAPGRPTLPPDFYEVEQNRLLFPKDGIFGGTWISCASDGRVACLLNGAFELHERKLPYRKSRGQVLLESYTYSSLGQMNGAYHFDNIEPFTLVTCQANLLEELRWDGEQAHYKTLDKAQPHLWASATLYTPEYIKKRHQWFKEWLKHHSNYQQKHIWDFHVTGGEGDVYNDIIMNRDDRVRTVSITSVLKDKGILSMTYRDLLKESEAHQQF